MSRIGKKPVSLPKGVSVDIRGKEVVVKGPKGQLNMTCPGEISASTENGTLMVSCPDDSRKNRALHGLTRSLINNMVVGVSEGFKRVLEIVGVGYRAEVKGNNTLVLALGYSHPVEFLVPNGISVQTDKKQTTITLEGIDKQLIGQVAANIRSLRSPDPYKGKGIRYAGESISLKAGKTGKK